MSIGGILATDLRLGDRVTFATHTMTDAPGREPGDARRTVLLTGNVEAIIATRCRGDR